ncbi:MAG: replication factor C small subunit [Candidatus Micrarchaeota archaeon]|nr:replication factor C small subunit [Candidatus Micrarchaeota archaeon]
MDLPWTEKYRPKSLNDVIGQKLIVDRLKSFVERGNFPNMIFAGSPGVGKTAAAVALAHDLYGSSLDGAFRELNASDDRGIDVIRGKVKDFARTISINKVPIKIIFLDEADALTADAQHALRRTMEMFAAETRFILNANYASKIIEPIQSRCVVFRFKHLNEDEMKIYINRIAQGEGLNIDDNAVEALIYTSEGDMRKLTNTLQSSALQNKNITEQSIYNVAARARPKEIVAMLNFAVTSKFDEARGELDNLILRHGMSAEDILTQCYREVQNLTVPERTKLEIMRELGDCNFKIVEGANERIQMEAMLASIALLSIKK